MAALLRAGVFTGSADEDGNTLGLPDDPAEVLVELIKRPKANPVRRGSPGNDLRPEW